MHSLQILTNVLSVSLKTWENLWIADDFMGLQKRAEKEKGFIHET